MDAPPDPPDPPARPAPPAPLVLASTSPYRRELLARLGLPFDVESPGIEETLRPGEAPAERARRLALEKALAAATRREDAWVIGSDQVAAQGARILHKPGEADGCRTQLASLSGAEASFHTAVTLVRGERIESHLDSTRVHFRALGAGEIERYIERERPFDCAGSFKSEGLGISLLAGLHTEDPTALIGLPLIWLAGALRRAGYRLP